MKKCSEIKELISLYIDDELEPDLRREFEEHVADCEECRNELDELTQIVGLCRNTAEEELPDGFKTELHQKLLEVRLQTEETAKPVLYRTKYFKLFSSIAAVFLLVFLVKGLYDFDVFPKGKTGQSADRANMLAEAPAETQKSIKAAAGDTGNNAGSTVEAGEEAAKDSYYAVNETQADGTEIDRSTYGGRETRAGSAVDESAEAVSRNTTSIIVTVEDPDAQVENIKAAAAESSGLEETALQTPDTETAYATDAEGNSVISVVIPNTQLNVFIQALNTDYGQGNVQPEAVVTEDMSVAIEDLLKQSDNLDLEIEKAEAADDAKAEDLNKLKEEKTGIQEKIDAIRLESDLTNVNVILKKK